MVEVTVVDMGGRVIDKREINKDLFEEYLRREEASGDLTTRWFIRLLYCLFRYTTKSSTSSTTVVRTDGSSIALIAKAPDSTYYLFNSTYPSDQGFYIGVGTGTAPPTRDDYRLANKIAEAYASAAVDEDAGVITLSAAFTFSTGQTITEVGLEWLVGYNPSYRMLCDRTVLSSPVTVPAGATLSVAYRFRL
jgi:hypothetical protein